MSREYTSAGEIVGRVLFNGENLKKICSIRKIVGKSEYALACETIKYAGIIKDLMKQANLTKESLDVSNLGVFYVMLYEMLFGKGKIDGGGAVKRKIKEHLSDFQRILQDMMTSKGVSMPIELLSETIQQHASLPRYVRINELKGTIANGLECIRQAFAIENPVLDKEIPSLVQLPCKLSGLGMSSLVKDGRLIIQDKASCFPSQILMDSYIDGDIIDCCAAPGNKTSHMAAMLAGLDRKGRDHTHSIYAFDKDHDRAQLLQKRMDEAGADNVHVAHHDFMTIDIEDEKYKNVTAILVDPSCSGSGVVRTIDRMVDAYNKRDDHHSDTSGRLQHLHDFQTSIVLKAMSFPHARMVVYSTCSLHEIENEAVVAEILSKIGIAEQWVVVNPPRMNTWMRRGHEYPGLAHAQSQCLIRCDPSDGMNGFFVTLFMKKPPPPPSSSSYSVSNKRMSDQASSTSAKKMKSNAHEHVHAPGDTCMICSSKPSKGDKLIWRPMSPYKCF